MKVYQPHKKLNLCPQNKIFLTYGLQVHHWKLFSLHGLVKNLSTACEPQTILVEEFGIICSLPNRQFIKARPSG